MIQTQHKKPFFTWKLSGLAILTIMAVAAFWYAPAPMPPPSDKTPSWESVQSTLNDLEPIWKQVEELILNGRILQADRLLDSELRPVWKGACVHHANRDLPDGMTLTTWVEAQEVHVSELLRSHFSAAIARVASGDLALDRLQHFLDLRDDPELFDILDASQTDLVQTRQNAASNWYRVVFQNPAEDLFDSHGIEKIIRSSAKIPPPLKLVFGPALSEEEQAATWNTLVVTGQVQTANFKAELNNSFNEQTWAPSPLVIGTSWYPTELRKDHPTSWASLEDLHVWLTPPSRISRSLEADIQQSYVQRIRTGARQALHRWPLLRQSPASE